MVFYKPFNLTLVVEALGGWVSVFYTRDLLNEVTSFKIRLGQVTEEKTRTLKRKHL